MTSKIDLAICFKVKCSMTVSRAFLPIIFLKFLFSSKVVSFLFNEIWSLYLKIQCFPYFLILYY